MNRIYLDENETEVISINSKNTAVHIKAQEISKLRRELLQVNSDLHLAYSLFNSATEDNLIYSSIYEINMLRSRYTYILQRIKQLSSQECGTERK